MRERTILIKTDFVSHVRLIKIREEVWYVGGTAEAEIDAVSGKILRVSHGR